MALHLPHFQQGPPATGPRRGTAYEVIPETGQRRIGLGSDRTSHLILDDYNKVRAGEFYDFESLVPVGSFSTRFLEKVARRFLEAIQQKRCVAGVSRR